MVLHIFITTHLDYHNALYVEVSQAALSCLQVVQNATALLLTGTHRHEHLTNIIQSSLAPGAL